MLADIPEDVQLLHETLLEAVQRADLPHTRRLLNGFYQVHQALDEALNVLNCVPEEIFEQARQQAEEKYKEERKNRH